MAELLIGAGALGCLVFLARLAAAREVVLRQWQWGIALLWVLYVTFVLLVVVEFVREGTPKGAVVMGAMMGFGAVVGAVLLERLIFRGGTPGAEASNGGSHG